ncbi:MAG: DNA-deoxyinosine glycosylase [Campylobacteraceae bacterium]|nr:DNA-deoxyinosine glycosylase [Campylobacteraceae bacterium]
MLKLSHPFDPVVTPKSTILILGTFPSITSRVAQFYYQHPQNRFWKVLSSLTCKDIPMTIEEKIAFLNQTNIALWDVVQECSIKNSSDSSIKEVIPNDISSLLKDTSITQIYANGAKAYQLYMKLCYPQTRQLIIPLPSTSPANASYSLERLIKEWHVIVEK